MRRFWFLAVMLAATVFAAGCGDTKVFEEGDTEVTDSEGGLSTADDDASTTTTTTEPTTTTTWDTTTTTVDTTTTTDLGTTTTVASTTTTTDPGTTTTVASTTTTTDLGTTTTMASTTTTTDLGTTTTMASTTTTVVTTTSTTTTTVATTTTTSSSTTTTSSSSTSTTTTTTSTTTTTTIPPEAELGVYSPNGDAEFWGEPWLDSIFWPLPGDGEQLRILLGLGDIPFHVVVQANGGPTHLWLVYAGQTMECWDGWGDIIPPLVPGVIDIEFLDDDPGAVVLCVYPDLVVAAEAAAFDGDGPAFIVEPYEP